MPGRPGLFFHSGDKTKPEELEQKRRTDRPERNRSFIRVDSDQWLYVGQYDVSFIAPLSKDDWKELSIKVQKTWIKGVLGKNWGRNQRVRILLRNRPGKNRRYTQADYHRLLEDKHRNFKDEVTADQVMDAFDRGEEMRDSSAQAFTCSASLTMSLLRSLFSSTP
ncbi:hypothetical protein L218DRAFT_938016 [Marasmius fiardii PR-910]|nr:hypothetical protein L218DRAFT_938016 [Marasmius fiardii PR-910]